MVMPVSVSPLMTAQLMGAAPRYCGNNDAYKSKKKKKKGDHKDHYMEDDEPKKKKRKYKSDIYLSAGLCSYT